jgi:hypothetical protein
MPIHDWTRVSAGTYHDFHLGWTVALRVALNQGVLPAGFEAVAEGKVLGWEPDVITVQAPDAFPGGVAVADAPPHARLTARLEPDALTYARRANRIAVRHESGAVVAVIEFVSPGNKHSTTAIEQFRDKAIEFLERGVNLVVIDPFPPTRRDPNGLHQLIWDRIASEPFPPAPDGKPPAVVSFDATDGLTVYVEPVSVGATLPEASLFLARGWYVRLPLEATYMRAWGELTPRVRALLG